MASHSLLDLVCQLQTFETKISEIVMEMAVKLCALNDTKLLVLLSTSMGRKVVGSPDLCNQFFQQRLRTDGTESYLELDPIRNTMTEVPIPTFDRNMPVFPGGFVFGGGGGGGGGSSGNGDARSRKRGSTDAGVVGGGEERSKSPRIESYGSVGPGIETQFETWDSDDVECCVVEDDYSKAVAIPSSSSSSAMRSNGGPRPLSASRQSFPPQVMRTINPGKQNASKSGNPDYQLPDRVREGMNGFFADNQYAHAFVDCDGYNVVSRDSKEHKVLTTLIMQFAKHCSPHCPSDKPDKTAFANLAFEILWQHCPNLHPFENYVINNGHQNYSMR